MELQYFYNQKFVQDSQLSEKHKKILLFLGDLKLLSKISDFEEFETGNTFKEESVRKEFLNNLRDFGIRHHVRLGRIFGSRKYGFSYLPPQFLLVKEGDNLKEVFPCEINGIEKGIIEFLEAIKQNRPWTNHNVPAARKTKHELIAEKIIQHPDVLEKDLRFDGRNVQVSQDFGELGYIDLIFKDRDNKYLLVEVKVKPDEIDKATGQILRHKNLFIKQNSIPSESIRLAIACPYIPKHQKEVCEEVGIECFEVDMANETPKSSPENSHLSDLRKAEPDRLPSNRTLEKSVKKP